MDELIELERAGWAPLCGGTGTDFYRQTIISEAVMVLVEGSGPGQFGNPLQDLISESCDTVDLGLR